MPVLINKANGNAENLEASAAQAAMDAGTHTVPLNDSAGNPVTAPADQAPDLISQGYSQPNSEQLQNLLKATKFGSAGQQVKTAAEGVASGATLGASTAAETALGIAKPEDVRSRAEINPGVHQLGEVAGIAGSALAGVGEGAVLTGAGKGLEAAAAAALGEGTASKIGSTAAKFAIENMVASGGSEADKLFYQDPNQSVETAAANIGLSGLIGAGLGGGIGTASELWKATSGKAVDATLNAMKNRASGLPVELKNAANMDLAPEIEGALGGGPKAQAAAAQLMESQTKAGTDFQAAMKNFHESASDALAESFGKTPEDVASLKESSAYETGKEFQSKLSTEIKAKAQPFEEAYNAIDEKFSNTKLSEADKSSIADKVAQTITEQGLEKGPNEAALKLAQKTLSQLPKQETLADLTNYARGLASAAPFGSEAYQTGKALRAALNASKDSVLEREAGGAGMGQLFKETQAGYAKFKGVLADLNDRLHLGREGKSGAGTFTQALSEMDPESVVKRLGLKGDVGLQQLLGEHFPETADLARSQEISGLLKKALGNTGERLDTKKLFKQLDALSPELKAYLVPDAAQTRIDAIKGLMEKLPTRLNPSGTAKTLDALWSKMPASAAAMASMITGHNPIIGAILGQLTHHVGREVPDAVKLATLKYLGASEATSASGFKAMVAMAAKTIKGEKALDASVEHVLESKSVSFEKADTSKLEQHVEDFITKPEQLLDGNDSTGHYLPDHGAAISMTAVRNLQYLASLKPSDAPLGPLDAKRVASDETNSKYQEALQIAENPLMLMQNISKGTITKTQIGHLQALYPELYGRMSSKLQQQLLTGKDLSYKTQLGLSAFLGQPLSASMSPMAIQSAQLSAMGPGGGASSRSSPTGSSSRLQKLDRLPASYSTPSQQRQIQRGAGSK